MDPAQVTTEQAPKKKKYLILILVFLLVVLGLILVWFFVVQKEESEPTTVKVSTSSAKIATTSTKIATTEASAVDDTALIKEALVVKTKISADQLEVTITKKEGNFVKGLVGTKGEEAGGGYFLAVKVSDTWTIAYDGQATPDCSVVNPYAFPASFVPECLDANGNLVTR